MSVVLDSNIYLYALETGDNPLRSEALRLVDWQFEAHGIVVRQVLGEILNATHRKRRSEVPATREWVAEVAEQNNVLPTDSSALIDASALAERYQLQFWDAVICTIARRHGASILFSEDMHDGLRLGTMTIVNPFAEANRALVNDVLS